MAYNPRLILRVLWHSDFSGGQDVAHHLFSRLCRDSEVPGSRGPGIPVYFHRGPKPEDTHITGINLDEALSTVVIALLDTSIRADADWQTSIEQLEARFATQTHRHLFLPIACEDKTQNLLNRANCIRLEKCSTAELPDRVLSAVTHELARLLLGRGGESHPDAFGPLEKSYAPVKLFISHSKHDKEGQVIATELRDYGRQHLPVATFYDSNDIAAGHNFESEIKANVAESAMIVVHTDVYSDRAWCRREVLFAKEYGCPVLVVNAIMHGEERLFPYLGNAPSVRWPFDSPNRCRIVIESAVREVLKNVYFLENVKALKSAGMLAAGCVEVGAAPEMLTYRNLVRAARCDRTKTSVLLYPDPPLGDEEIEVLQDLNPTNLQFATPTTISIASRVDPTDLPFQSKMVALSISESKDLVAQDMDLEHLRDAMVEVSRHLLAQGATLAYGGDLRPGGFTTSLFELVRSHNRAGTKERVHNFLAWPIHLRLDVSVWKEYLDESHFHQVQPPIDLAVEPQTFVEPFTPESRYAWARSLTAMRLAMNEAMHGRILIGGQVTGFKGKYPGVLEEALHTIGSGKPLYLVGAFGGCTRLIIEALKGGSPAEFTTAYQAQHDPILADLQVLYDRDAIEGRTTPIAYEAELAALHASGISGLNNGLSKEENERLFVSSNLPEIVYLILKGLSVRLNW